MADGDRVHKGLSQRWQTPYKQVQEWCLPVEEIAYACLKRLQKECEDGGEGPINYIRHIAERLLPLGTAPVLQHSLDWLSAGIEIEDLAQALPGRASAVAAERACEQMRNEARTCSLPSERSEIEAEAIESYLWNLFDIAFAEKAPFNPSSSDGAAPDTIRERLVNLRSQMRVGVASLARQIARRDSSLTRLRLTGPRAGRSVDADTEVALPA